MPHARRPIRTLSVLTILAAAVAGTGTATARSTAAQTGCTWVGSRAPVEQRVGAVLHRMTQQDKVAMVHGITEPEAMAGAPGTTPPTYVGEVPAIPRLCVPALHLEDGPSGVGDGLTGVTQLPAPVTAAASWDPSVARRYGALIGAEQRGKGTNVALTPTVNIVRDPRWGRAFESYGEDPYLSGRIAAAHIEGVQGQGVVAQVKHWAVYNQEFGRDTPIDNAQVDDRTLHEIYLPAFEAAIRDAHAGTVMCSYNEVNGVPACQSDYLLTQVLKGELGFDGFVTSDWLATQSSAEAAAAGLDMQMPDGCYFGPQLIRSIQAGRVSPARLDDMVRRILRVMFRFGLFDRPATGSTKAKVTSAAHARVARQVAEAGAVLLKNSGNALPVDLRRTHSIAVIGADGGSGATTSGGGSSTVVPPYVVTPYDGIRARAGHGVTVTYDDGSNPASAVATAQGADVAVVFASLAQTESQDLKTIDLSGAQNALIQAVATANPHTVVVLDTGSAVTMPWLDSVAGVLEAWYPGQEDGNAVAALLFGDVNPSGKLPVTFPRDLTQVPASTPQQWPGGQYSEGLLVGYRWYDAKALTPLFPFGFGLSYTTFRVHGLTVRSTGDGRAAVQVAVTNTGRRSGAEVVQTYVAQPASAGEPPHRLAGFAKVFLHPGETRRVTMQLDVRAFSHWDAGSRRWLAPSGRYGILVGTSSRDLPLKAAVVQRRSITTGRPTPPATAIPASATSPQTRAEEYTSCPKDWGAPWIAGGLSVAGVLP